MDENETILKRVENRESLWKPAGQLLLMQFLQCSIQALWNLPEMQNPWSYQDLNSDLHLNKILGRVFFFFKW